MKTLNSIQKLSKIGKVLRGIAAIEGNQIEITV